MSRQEIDNIYEKHHEWSTTAFKLQIHLPLGKTLFLIRSSCVKHEFHNGILTVSVKIKWLWY